MDTMIMINWSISKVVSRHPLIPAGLGGVGLFWTGFHSMSVWVGGLEGETALNVDIIKQPHKISIHIPSSSLYIPDHPLRCVIPAASDWEEEGGRGIILDRMRQDFLPTNLTICSTANNRFGNLCRSSTFAPGIQSSSPKHSKKSLVFCALWLLYMVVFNDTNSNANLKDYLFDQLSILLFPLVELSFWCFDKSHWICATFSTGFIFLWHFLALQSRIPRFTTDTYSVFVFINW